MTDQIIEGEWPALPLGAKLELLGPTVKFKRLPHGEGLPLPSYATDGAAGMDLAFAGLTDQESFAMRAVVERFPYTIPYRAVGLLPGQRKRLWTGFAIAVPPGYEAQVRPRSGLADKHGVTVLNSPGTIDCDYRGEIQVILINHGERAVHFSPGDRIAQLVIAPVTRAKIVEADALGDTARGEGGFGSTGT